MAYLHTVGSGQATAGHSFYVSEYGFVADGVLVPAEVLHLHKGREIAEQIFPGLGIFHTAYQFDKRSRALAVVGGLHRSLLEGNRLRPGVHTLLLRLRIRGIHIEFEIGNDLEVVPELLFIIVLEMDLRIQQFHHLDHGTGLLISLVPVLDGLEIGHHFLHISSVFREFQGPAAGVVLETALYFITCIVHILFRK